MNDNHSQLPRLFWYGPAPIFALLLGVLPPTAAYAQTALPPAIREELAVLRDAKDVSPEAIERLCEIGDATPQQNLQQLCYKTACAGLAYLDATNRYEEVLAKVITKTFVDVFQEQCPRCRGIGKTRVTCPDCEGRRCPSCNETGMVRDRCPDCNGTASVFSRERALSAYRRGLDTLAKTPETATSAHSALPRRLTDDQFFVRHSLDQVAYAVFTNRNSTSIQKNEAFRQISTRAYKPHGFSTSILLNRYPSGRSYKVVDVAQQHGTYKVTLADKPINMFYGGTITLIIPDTVTDISHWGKGREVNSRDWVYPCTVFSNGRISTLSPNVYRSIAEFRRIHPGAEDIDSP